MSNWRPDQIDLWCREWANERRKIFGLSPVPDQKFDLKPQERLGKLYCTLGQIRDEAEGAAQKRQVNENGHYPQNFPEVYTGVPLEIHRAFKVMRGQWREVMDAHYVFRDEKPKKKAAMLGITEFEYWKRLGHLKIFIGGHLGIDLNVRPRSHKTPAMKNTQENASNALLSSSGLAQGSP